MYVHVNGIDGSKRLEELLYVLRLKRSRWTCLKPAKV